MTTTDLEDDILDAVENIDKGRLLPIIHGTSQKAAIHILKGLDVYHRLISAVQSQDHLSKEATQIIYIFNIHGADINHQDQNGDIALLCYLRQAEHVCDDFLQAFLRCGADVTLKNQFGEDVLGYILQADNLSRQVKARVLEYMPGIWYAVESDDACTVRRLINQWCSIRVVKNGMSVVELAFSKGTENIIRVITGIGTPMDLAYGVLAGDLHLVKNMLQSKCKVNVNMKNMSERGATPLFYAMCQNNRDMVDLLLKHGASLVSSMHGASPISSMQGASPISSMQGENQMELPLYFAALSTIPQIDVDLLRHTIPQKPVSVDQLYYKGRNTILYCIEHDVDPDLFEDILRHSSAHVLTQKIQENLDARDYAQVCNKMQYRTRIDKIVREWCSDVTDTSNRNILALHGYPLTSTLIAEGDGSPQTDHVIQFLQLLPNYEECKIRLRTAIEDGDVISVKKMLYCDSWSDRGLEPYLVDSRVCGDGQPLLHKAVLRGHIDVVREIAEVVFHKCNRKLDTIRDQCFRTALHYLYGMDHGKHMIYILEDLGMSEFAMDKDGRSPLAFKDRRGQKEMNDLLNYHLLQDFSTPEPDPWSVPLPMPIMGYLSKCVHAHHAKKNQSNTSKLSTPDQYDSIDPSVTACLSSSGYGDAGDQYSQIGTGGKQDKGLALQSTRSTDHYTNMHYNANSLIKCSHGSSVNVGMGLRSDMHTYQHQYDELQIQATSRGLSDIGNYTDGEYIRNISGEHKNKSAKRCKSEDTIKSRLQYGVDDFEGDNSDSLSEASEEGDYSDVESEEEQASGLWTNYCVIL